jgi:hypothetical protein
MDKEAYEEESNHEELIRQRVRHHDEGLFHGDARGPIVLHSPTPVLSVI